MAGKKTVATEQVEKTAGEATGQPSGAEAKTPEPQDKETETGAGVETPEPQGEETGASGPPLERLNELAAKYRIPSWQSAALCTLMGWESGKLVSDAEYKNGLARLKNRRIGG